MTFPRLFIGLWLICATYVLIPSSKFPPPPPNVLQSHLPGDRESIYRRAYYTNLDRSELMAYYSQAFKTSPFLPQIRLNHPPEFAYTLIRDQTKSSYLEEYVHPFRESILINGYEPTEPSQQINVQGVHYKNKVTIRLLPSDAITRLTCISLTLWLIWLIFRTYASR